MAKALVNLFKENNLIAQTIPLYVETPDVNISESLVDDWADAFRGPRLKLKSLNAEDWDTIEFNCEGTVYTRTRNIS